MEPVSVALLGLVALVGRFVVDVLAVVVGLAIWNGWTGRRQGPKP
jgi:hypothetical protein